MFCRLAGPSLNWHFGQTKVTVNRKDHDFRVITTIGHALHTGQATRTASTDSGSPIEFSCRPPHLETPIKSLRLANAASGLHHDDGLPPLPQPMPLLRRGEERQQPKRRE